MRLLTMAVLAVSLALADGSFAQAPSGFIEYRVKTGDTLSKIASRKHWDLIERINRIDAQHLIIGKTIYMPTDLELADKFQPVPEKAFDSLAIRLLVIYLGSQYFGAYENGELKFWGPISSGAGNFRTPPGKYATLWKARHYISKKYDTPMPYAVNFSPDGYFLHQQSLPGRPASHGCVRLRQTDAKLIFDWILKKDLIIILS